MSLCIKCDVEVAMVKFEHVNIAVQNSTLVARTKASHASRFCIHTWTALFKEQKEHGSGATFMVGKRSSFV